MAKPKRLGIGDKPKAGGNPMDLGLSMRERTSNSTKLRGETSEMKQQPKHKKESISSDRGSFKCC